jgi:enoyl-ACP reductase-like protein
MPEMKARMIKRTALRRPGEPQDIANAIAFLCSDLASYITGVGLKRRHRALHLLSGVPVSDTDRELRLDRCESVTIAMVEPSSGRRFRPWLGVRHRPRGVPSE